jgi:transcriptional regulator GlxA family with amidase domain
VFGDHPPLDVLLVPGGAEASLEPARPALAGWVARTARGAAWTAGTGTGTLLLHAAGPARGRRVTTRFAFAGILEARGNVTVDRDVGFMVDGRLVTSQGVSDGIDMALWLIGCLHGRDHARDVRRSLTFEPAPA